MEVTKRRNSLPTIFFSALALFLALGVSSCALTGSTPAQTALNAEQIAAIIASPERSAADRSNDVRRKPDQLLAFIGINHGMRVLDLSAGGGYTSELLARAVGPGGRVYGQSPPRAPDSPALPAGRLSSPQALAERARNPAVANIIPVVRKFEDPVPPELVPDGLDLVTLMFNYHDLGSMGVDRTQMNRALFMALKPGGHFVIADHSGRPGTGISESATLHRIEEAFLQREVEAAGFKLEAQGDFLRNPSDPRDRNTPEPPQAKDEFVLKFVKPQAPPR